MSLADKTGWLAVLGGKKMTKTWKRRWVVAQYSTLYLFKDEASAAHGTPSLVIDLSDYTKATVVDSARSGTIDGQRSGERGEERGGKEEREERRYLPFVSKMCIFSIHS
jgi:hypothetical protein